MNVYNNEAFLSRGAVVKLVVAPKTLLDFRSKLPKRSYRGLKNNSSPGELAP